MTLLGEPLQITFTIAPDSVGSLVELIAIALGDDLDSVKASRRKEVSRNAIFGSETPPAEINLMVTRFQAAELLQFSTRKIDSLKAAEGRMPQPNRIGKAVRWNRAELIAWVDAGCPDCNEWKYSP